MEFDQEEANMEIAEVGSMAKAKEDEDYRIRKVRMTQQKKGQKTTISKNEVSMIGGIKKKT